jgi:hypothetical protein
MMIDFHKHPLFTPWQCPVTGTQHYILSNPDNCVQLPPYYATSAFSTDETLLWGYLRYGPTAPDQTPPHPGDAHSDLVIADLEHGVLHRTHGGMRYPSALFDEGRQLFFFTREASLFSVDRQGKHERHWFTLPESITKQGLLLSFGCHLSLSADKRRLGLDGRCGTFTFVGFYDLESCQFQVVLTAENMFYNHTIYSPTDPNQMYFCHEWWHHPVTNEYNAIDHRVWIVRTDDNKPPVPLLDETQWGQPTHEWWAPSGKAIYSIINDKAVVKIDIASNTVETVWEGPHCHAQCDKQERYFVADQHTYMGIPIDIYLYDHLTKNQWPLRIGQEQGPKLLNRFYHLDPHPQISPQNNMVCYYGNQRGIADLCICPIDHIIKKTDNMCR